MPRPEARRSLQEYEVAVPGGAGYRVVAGAGASRRLPFLLSSRGASRAALICDSNIESIHAPSIRELLGQEGIPLTRHVFPAGEASKTRETKARLEDELLAEGHGRDSVVVALGGGVTVDLAGFVAATYMRGIPVVHLPTSLLAMADASIGGKSGVDHPMGKNLIGAFHPPWAVLADTRFLESLPPAEIREGLAEMAKAGVIHDEAHFEMMEREGAALVRAGSEQLEAALIRSMKVKIDVVTRDEREGDLRKILNFGHTIGHALERVSGYRIRHGEAVAIGMVAECRMAVEAGYCGGEMVDRISGLLRRLGLPVVVPEMLTSESILEATRADKKSRGGSTEYVLPSGIGRMVRGTGGYGLGLPREVVLDALDRSR